MRPTITSIYCRRAATKTMASWPGCAGGTNTMSGRDLASTLARRAATPLASVASLAALIGAVLVPKCPLCIAAALSALGVGAAVARQTAPLVHHSALVLGALGLIALAWLSWRWARTAS